MADADGRDGALRLTMEVRHPGCWIIEVTTRTRAGMLGYGIHTNARGRATTLFTVYGETVETVDEAIEAIRSSPHVHAVDEIDHNYRIEPVSTPGNARREILVDHDGTTTISPAFTARGFVYAEPVDARDGIEHWTLLSNHDRATVRELLDEVREVADAELTVTGLSRADGTLGPGGLPLDRLTRRQREVFRHARSRGYYAWPRRIAAGDLAAELGISTSTLHEHLHRAEAALLGPRSG